MSKKIMFLISTGLMVAALGCGGPARTETTTHSSTEQTEGGGQVSHTSTETTETQSDGSATTDQATTTTTSTPPR